MVVIESMPEFHVTTIEKHMVRCQYSVDAKDKDEAVSRVQRGEVAFYDREVLEGENISDEVLEVEAVTLKESG